MLHNSVNLSLQSWTLNCPWGSMKLYCIGCIALHVIPFLGCLAQTSAGKKKLILNPIAWCLGIVWQKDNTRTDTICLVLCCIARYRYSRNFTVNTQLKSVMSVCVFVSYRLADTKDWNIRDGMTVFINMYNVCAKSHVIAFLVQQLAVGFRS